VRAKIWCCGVQACDARKNEGARVCALKFGVAQKSKGARMCTLKFGVER
jgi:hypothetical protein